MTFRLMLAGAAALALALLTLPIGLTSSHAHVHAVTSGGETAVAAACDAAARPANLDFTLEDMNGNDVAFESLKGKVMLLNFWATWCGTCEVEMPSMEKLYRKYKDFGFEMLTISVDKDQSLIEPFMKKFNLTFPVLLDPESKIAKKIYKTTGVPETFIVNREGLIVHKAIGPRDWANEETLEAFSQMVLGS